MSLLIDDLSAYLEDQGEGTVAVDIFSINRPTSPVACLSMHPTGGFPPDRYTRRERPSMQIVARAATPQGALTKAYSVFGKLHGKQNVALQPGGLWALTIEAMGSPGYIGMEQAVSPAGDVTAHLASVNFAFDLRQPST